MGLQTSSTKNKAEKAEKETAAKKSAARKTKAPEVEVFFQYAGGGISANRLLDQVKAIHVSEGQKVSELQSIQLYIKPEESAAYYIINGQADGKKIEL